MKASAGVIAIACLTFIGSTLCLLTGIATALMFVLVPAQVGNMPQQSPLPAGFFKIMAVFSALMYIAPAVWGFVTGVGLLKLRNWARISTIVFSVLLICMTVFSMLTMVLIGWAASQAPDVDRTVMVVAGAVMAVVWLGHLAVGIWWLVYLTRPTVRERFVRPSLQDPSGAITTSSSSLAAQQLPPIASRGSKVPVSINIIAWWMLIGCVFVPINIALRAPAVFFTWVLTGLPAISFFIAALALHSYIGIGLLKLKQAARLTCIAWLVFGIVNSGVFFLAPGRDARTQAIFQKSMAMYPWMRSGGFPIRFDPTPFLYVGMVFGVLVALVPLYFLVTRKQAFQHAQ